MKNFVKCVSIIIVIIGLLVVGSLSLLVPVASIPSPSGDEPVGRVTCRLTDLTRMEKLTDSPGDHRKIVIHIWYPASTSGKQRADYFPDLPFLHGALRRSGEMIPLPSLRFLPMSSVWWLTLRSGPSSINVLPVAETPVKNALSVPSAETIYSKNARSVIFP